MTPTRRWDPAHLAPLLLSCGQDTPGCRGQLDLDYGRIHVRESVTVLRDLWSGRSGSKLTTATVAALAEAAEEAGVSGEPVEGSAAGAAGPRLEVPLWREGVGLEVLPSDCARIVALVQEDAAGGGEGMRARAMREQGWSASDAKERAARFRAKRLVERGWLTEVRPGLFRPRTA